eukprot:Blabericola_migrator_1__2466@NODE_1696_length_3982_cov_82_762197_g354_i1_p1_GENE_NODE_1696_length_3982_cov_82_762197_g354_i1NODE_1696_length_3982_cov_82_762197_g354_i1_p1_ORF_typecomplete_len402_score48_25PAM2/PF07145_15/1e03PAM2/PF07145_15/0_017_NODE_1696_length_3982_cov_82_762197_g354_i19482153
MARFLKLNPSRQSEISLGDVITIGLVCAAGDGVCIQSGEITSSRGEGPSEAQSTQEDVVEVATVAASTDICEKSSLNPGAPPFYPGPEPLYPFGSFQWIEQWKSCNYGVPKYFQITPRTGPRKVLKILEERFECLCADSLGEARGHCTDLFNALKTQSITPTSYWLKLLNQVTKVVFRFATTPRSSQGTEGLVGLINGGTLYEKRMKNEVRLSEDQYKVLCFLEPAVSFMKASVEQASHVSPLLHQKVMLLLALVRTTLLRHHVLTRLSSMEYMTDNRAAEYCRAVLGSSAYRATTLRESGGARCIYLFVRHASQQQIAKELLDALSCPPSPIRLNICFIIARDMLGHEDPSCPLDESDIAQLFNAEMSFSHNPSEYETVVNTVAAKIRPWLAELAGMEVS